MQLHIRLAGHAVRTKDYRFQKELIYDELSQDNHSTGSQKKKSTSKTLWWSPWNLSVWPQITWNIWHRTDNWREVVKRGAKVCETRRNSVTELHRKLRKDTATSATAATIPCYHCPRIFDSQIGLIRHLRTHGCLPQS